MKHLLTTALALLMLAALASCIRDELQPCPPLSVQIAIEDKNYFNIDDVERVTGLDHRLPEDQPFRYYIQKLFYVLYDLDRRETVTVRHLHDVQGDALTATAYLPEDLPFGRYVFLVWGNIDSEDGIMADGSLATYDLHRDHVEGYDVYMTCDTLLFDEWHYDYTVHLQRVKGKLLIEGANLPAHINWSRKAVTRLSGNVDFRFDYQPDTHEYVVTETDWSDTPAAPSIVTDTYLAPTVTQDEDSRLYLRFFDDPSMTTPVLTPPEVDIRMNRNEITVLRYVYNDADDTFSIYVLINDAWQVLHDMVLE